MSLTPNATQTLYFSGEPPITPEAIQPVLQVLSVKKVPANGAAGSPDRYRLILSDGDHFMQSMLATQLNEHVDSGVIDRNSVIKITGFALNNVQQRRLLIVLDVEGVAQGGEKIGEPKNIDHAINPNNAQAQAPTTSAASAPAAAAAKPAPAARGGFTGGAAAARGGASSTSGARGGRGGGGGSARGGDHGPLYPIEGLSPYQNKWTIKARVTQKSDVKVWSNARGEGKLFSVTLMDETGEIKATGFNEAVESFFELLQEGKVYFISKARINIAKKQFSTVNNDYEIAFDGKTEIEAAEDEGAVPQIKFNFIELSALDQMEKDQTCDVLAIVKDVSEVTSITGKTSNRPVTKRELTIVDRSEFSCRLTLWGKTAENYSAVDQPVIAFKGVKVGDFGGRTLSMFSSSSMTVSPDIPEAHSLRGWYDSQGDSKTFRSHSNGAGAGGSAGGNFKADTFKTIGEIRDEGIGMNDTTDWFSLKATAIFIKSESMSYPACSTEGCNKKVVEDGGQWRCEKCQKSWDEPNWRYILSISVLDHSGQMWLTGFNDIGELLLGVNANEMKRLSEEDQDEAKSLVTKASGQMFNFNCSGKMDTFQEQSRARFSIKRAAPIDYAASSKALAEKIRAYGMAC
ncbi:hypothetical protein BDY24DRAFT_414880 [Mrakia frigida]|uniref:uncharacterized protein n=1 Tax=Mrakia frigida TaxID=29902 RepID=UPI003FCC17EC